MPTGYTAAIKDGIEFNEFVWGCARAFGALVLMRDDPSDAPIPEFAPSDYHSKELKRATADLARLQAMSVKDAEFHALKAYESEYGTVEKWNRDKAALQTKYEAMLEQVNAWEPPTAEHEGLKKFMVEQIQQSITHDCHLTELPEPKQAKEWLRLQIENAKRSIEYHTKELAEEIERTNGRNGWVKALAESVPMPAKIKNAA